jgi:catalase
MATTFEVMSSSSEQMSKFNDSMSRRTALALGSLAGVTAAGAPLLAGSDADPSGGQLSATPEGTAASNGLTIADSNGAAGELHQNAGGSHPSLTNNQGITIADDENSLKIAPRGPVLLEDFMLREKINHFDHERIPERVVHARGTAAHGHFELTTSLSDVSKAGIFNRVGERTPVFVRFSTVAGNKGSSDTARDVRGFAVKFYTQEGNWDLVGNNIPVFFIQDAIKFPDLIHAAKPEPDREFPQAQTAHDTFWDYASLTPESTHMLMWVMSDRAIPRSFRMMEGFGIHTFRLVNQSGKSTYVKFHWRPKQGMQSLIWDEALKINGADPDYHRRDLWNAIDTGDFPEWELGVQLFDEDFAKKFEFDVLDASKIIPEEQIPLKMIGRLVLDRNPANFFAETEQVAFCPTHVVPGIDFTNDPLLQGRLFSYLDTQMTRLGGPNFAEIPINRPKCPVMNFQRDGHMQVGVPQGRVNYSPSSLADQVPRANPTNGYTSFAAREQGDTLRIRAASFADHFSQARQFFYSLSEPEQNHLVAAFTFELSKVETQAVRTRMLSQLANVDMKIAERVASGLAHQGPIQNAPTTTRARTDLKPSPALSILAKAQPTMKGRVIGCLIADGTDPALVTALRSRATQNGAKFKVIAPKVGGAKGANGQMIPADFQLAGGPSVLFDAIVLAVSSEGAQQLIAQAAAVSFVQDAFSHLKVIGHTATATSLLQRAGALPDRGIVSIQSGASSDAFLTEAAKGRVWEREPTVRPII